MPSTTPAARSPKSAERGPKAAGRTVRRQLAPVSNGKPARRKTRPMPNASVWQIVALPIESIAPSPYQPRFAFDENEMADLVASVRAKGVQQPIIVRSAKPDAATSAEDNRTSSPDDNTQGTARSIGKRDSKPLVIAYELIAGERRLRACKAAGRKTIPAIVRDDLSDAECAELALLENVQRSNLSVIEEARGYKRLMLQFRMKEEWCVCRPLILHRLVSLLIVAVVGR